MAAGGSLGSLTIDLAANITRFERSLTRAERLADKRAKSIERTFKRMAGGIAVALASFGFVRAIESSLEFADSIGKTADKLGLATSSLQEYRFAAEQTGLTTQQLDVGIQRFSRRIAEAAEGSGVLKDVLDRLNIPLRDANGTLRSTEAVLDDYADAIQNASSSNEQLLLAFKAFDTEGVAFVNTLKNGSAGLQKFRDEAKDMGIIMSEDLVRGAEEAKDRLNVLDKIIRINMTNAVVALAPQISALANALSNLATGKVNELPGFMKKIALSFKVLEFAAGEATSLIGKLGASLVLLGSGEFSALSELWKETAENTEAAKIKLDEYVERMNAITIDDEEKEGDGGTKEKPNFFTGLTDTEMERQLQLAIDMEARNIKLFDEREKQEKLRAAAAVKSESIIQSARFTTFNQGLQLLQAFAGKSKSLALASIAVSKGIAIAESLVTNETAAIAAGKSAALAAPPGAGVAAYAAAYGQVKSLGALSVGLIAATGFAQAASLSGGGAAPGTVANPTFTTSESFEDPFAPAAQVGTTGTITINVNGVITDEIMQDLVIPAIQNATNDKDIILFNNDSRQAIELEA